MIDPESMAEAVAILTALTLDEDEGADLAAELIQASMNLPALALTLAALLSETVECLDERGISRDAFLQSLGMQAAEA